MSTELKKIYLNDYHKDNNAKFTSFAGYSMPINYGEGIIKENLHVRSSAGLFDVSHMGQILITTSNQNIDNLEKYIPLKLSNIKKNKCYYSFLLNNQGGVIDDIILSKINYQNIEYLFIVYNAGRKKEDEYIFSKILSDYIILNNHSLLAIQGPLSENALNFLFQIKNLKFMNSAVIDYLDHSIIISRSGYTGEDGFEISIPNTLSLDFIKKIMINSNIKLCGLGSRDSLRLEAGLCLYGNELNEFTTPIEANLNWTINKERLVDKKLNGYKILLNQINNVSKKHIIALKSFSKLILRSKMLLFDSLEKNIGHITSGTYSPSLKSSIAIGYINRNLNTNEKIYTNIRNVNEELKIVKLPFVLHNYKKG